MSNENISSWGGLYRRGSVVVNYSTYYTVTGKWKWHKTTTYIRRCNQPIRIKHLVSRGINQINSHTLPEREPRVWRIGMMVVSQGPSPYLNPIQIRTAWHLRHASSCQIVFYFFHCPDLRSSAMLNVSSRWARWVLEGKDTISQTGRKACPWFLSPHFPPSPPQLALVLDRFAQSVPELPQVRVHAGLPTLGGFDRLPISSDSNAED